MRKGVWSRSLKSVSSHFFFGRRSGGKKIKHTKNKKKKTRQKMSSNIIIESLTTRQSWGWWWPVLLALALAGLVYWQIEDRRDESDYKGPAPEVNAVYYQQKPYLVLDVPITPWTTHIGHTDESLKNQVPVNKALSQILGSSWTRDTPNGGFWVRAIPKGSGDAIDRLQFWKVLEPGPDNTARNAALTAFNDLKLHLFTVNDKKQRRTVAKVAVHVPTLAEEPRLVDLIRDRRIPIDVPEALLNVKDPEGNPLYPQDFDFGAKVNWRDITKEGEEEKQFAWEVTFAPPKTVSGQNDVKTTVTRTVLGDDGELEASLPDDASLTSAWFFAGPDEENKANFFRIGFKRGAYDVGADEVHTCPPKVDDFFKNPECRALYCLLHPTAGRCVAPQNFNRVNNAKYRPQQAAAKQAAAKHANAKRSRASGKRRPLSAPRSAGKQLVGKQYVSQGYSIH